MSVVRRWVLAALAAILLVALPTAARADGDPASDVLYTQDVFVPYPPPAPSAVRALRRSVAAAYARRYRIKVAVIATSSDLGAVPELFGKPSAYARFLGQEIAPIFVGPLLIVMPAGFGIYDGGRSTAAEERVLASLDAGGSSADVLTHAATTAVQKLTAAGALSSKDIRGPQVFPRPASARPGTRVRLTYAVVEDSERTQDVVRILAGRTQKAILRAPMRPALYSRPHSAVWNVPRTLKPGALTFCVVATDPAGHRSLPACGPLQIRA